MNVPSPLPSGEPVKRGWDKVREILQYLRSIRLVAGPGIRLQHNHAGIIIEATATATGAGTATGYSGIFAVSLVAKNNSASLTISAGRCYVNGEPVEVEEVSGVTPSTGWLLLALTRSRSGDGAEFTAEYLIEDEIPPMPTATEDDPDPVLKYPVARIDGSGGNWTIAQTHFYNPPFLTIYGDCETWTTPSGEMGT